MDVGKVGLAHRVVSKVLYFSVLASSSSEGFNESHDLARLHMRCHHGVVLERLGVEVQQRRLLLRKS